MPVETSRMDLSMFDEPFGELVDWETEEQLNESKQEDIDAKTTAEQHKEAASCWEMSSVVTSDAHFSASTEAAAFMFPRQEPVESTAYNFHDSCSAVGFNSLPASSQEPSTGDINSNNNSATEESEQEPNPVVGHSLPHIYSLMKQPKLEPFDVYASATSSTSVPTTILHPSSIYIDYSIAPTVFPSSEMSSSTSIEIRDSNDYTGSEMDIKQQLSNLTPLTVTPCYSTLTDEYNASHLLSSHDASYVDYPFHGTPNLNSNHELSLTAPSSSPFTMMQTSAGVGTSGCFSSSSLVQSSSGLYSMATHHTQQSHPSAPNSLPLQFIEFPQIGIPIYEPQPLPVLPSTLTSSIPANPPPPAPGSSSAFYSTPSPVGGYTPPPQDPLVNSRNAQKPAMKRRITAVQCHENSVCANCGTRETTLWRRSADGSTECNACNLYARKNNRRRPLTLLKSGIQKRNRKPRSEHSPSSGGTHAQGQGKMAVALASALSDQSLANVVAKSKT